MTRSKINLLLLRWLARLVSVLCAGVLPAFAQPPAQQDPPARVSVEAVTVSTLSAPLALTGSVVATRASALSPQVAGVVSALNVEIGDVVSAGDVLLQLDGRLAVLALERLRAEEVEARTRLADANRLAAEAQRLGPDGGVARSLIDTRRAEAQVARAALTSRSSAVAEQAERVARHALRAPYAGVVTARAIDLGEWAVPGATVLGLVDLQSLRIDVSAPQHVYPRLADGAEVVVRSDAEPGRQWVARIDAVVPAADPAARTVPVRLAVDDPSGLIPGLSVRAALQFADGETLQIPRDAVLRRPDGTSGVWVVEQDGNRLIAASRKVMLGVQSANRVVVRSGLQRGDRVVTRGNEDLREGRVVQLVSPTGQDASRP